MFLAKVIGIGLVVGEVARARRHEAAARAARTRSPISPATPAGAAPAPTHDGVVCADVLGAGVGEDVVIAYGHAARVAVSELLPDGAKPSVPIDAAVVAIVDRWAVNKQ